MSQEINRCIFSQRQGYESGMVAHIISPSTCEAETSRFVSSKPAWSIKEVPGLPGLYRETLSQTKKQTNPRVSIFDEAIVVPYRPKVQIKYVLKQEKSAEFSRLFWVKEPFKISAHCSFYLLRNVLSPHFYFLPQFLLFFVSKLLFNLQALVKKKLLL